MEPFGDAYCGLPPAPADLWTRWNTDPWLLAISAALLGGYLLVSRSAPAARRWMFSAGWLVTVLALVSPLCALSVALFSARAGQHVVLILVAAPLIAFAAGPQSRRRASPVAAAAVLSALLWLWHTPGAYAATFRSDAIYWVMHISLFGSAIWFWRGCGARRGGPGAMPALLLAASQMTLLGGLLTFAGRALFAPHLVTARAWGLTPLSDQQLGGLLMWAPGSALFLVLTVLMCDGWLRQLERDGAQAR
jgi:putative membrane protein